MKFLGKWKTEFSSITSPVTCSDKCDELFAASAPSSALLQVQSGANPPKDAMACKTTCQRFGMKLLGKWKSEFSSIDSPVACSDKCDEIFAASAPSSSLLQARTGVP